MTNQTPHQNGTQPDRSAFAAVTAILIVLPALIPGALIVAINTFIFKIIVGNQGSWVPYLDEVALQWFPKLLGGGITGIIAIEVTSYLFKNSNLQVARVASLAFWSGVVLLILVSSISVRGLSLDPVGAIALLVGLGVGLMAAISV